MMKDSPTTKKMLVAFDPTKPEKATSDFLVPVSENGRFVFFGTKSKRNVALGMVVFVGRDVTVSDVFARLVDSGREIPVVGETLGVVERYLSQMSTLRVGQVVQLVCNAPEGGFTFQRVEVSKYTDKPLLP